jgi:hypothetical protein
MGADISPQSAPPLSALVLSPALRLLFKLVSVSLIGSSSSSPFKYRLQTPSPMLVAPLVSATILPTSYVLLAVALLHQ